MMSSKNPNIPKWLKRLQENSWEMEILISGGAIFSLFQLSDIYIDWVQQIRMTNHLPGSGPLLILGMFGIKVLTLGFILHLVSRGFWLSLVCLNDVFPLGVKKQKLNWKKPFKQNIGQEETLKDQIINVDKVCGTIMYLSIVSAFTIIGLALIVIFFSFILFIIDSALFFNVISSLFFIYLLLYIFDLLLFGILRRIPILTYLFYPVFKLFDFLSLRNSYQQSLWVFNTNIKRLRFSSLAIIFLFVAFIFTFNSLYKVMHWPNILDDREYRFQMTSDETILNDFHYMDNWDYSRSIPYGISKKIVQDDWLEVYLRYNKAFDILIEETADKIVDRRFDQIIEILIDGKALDSLHWLDCKKLNSDIGIATVLDLSNYSEGQHTLTYTVKEKYIDSHNKYINQPIEINIPFWIFRKQISNSINAKNSN